MPRTVATGAANREIAARLHLREGTVKNHISRILGLRDRTQAAARDRGLIRAPLRAASGGRPSGPGS